MSERIYLDYNATAPLRPEAKAAMLRVIDHPGNASSPHGEGREARRIVEAARQAVANLCGTVPNQIIFNAGATEANNAVLKTFAGERVLVSAIEHPSVMECLPQAEKIPVTAKGTVDLDGFDVLLRNGAPPALVSVMLVNNETGVIQPVLQIAARARIFHPGVHVHADAVQAGGRIPLDFTALSADYMSLSAHKIGGPQGVGALVMAPGAKLAHFLHGGGQEKRQRAGTENVAGIAGFGAAAEAAQKQLEQFSRLRLLHDRLEREAMACEPHAVIIGADAVRVANTTVLALPGITAETQLMALDLAGIAVSSGAACSSGTVRISPVLQAMGVSDAVAMGALRISSGWATTDRDVDRFLAAWAAMRERVKDRIKA